MTRESKLALIIGFVLVLVVGVLVSDHFSQASTMALDIQQPEDTGIVAPITDLGARESQPAGGVFRGNQFASEETQQPTRNSTQDSSQNPVMISNSRTSQTPASTGGNNSLIDRAFNEARNRVQNTQIPSAKIGSDTGSTPPMQALPNTRNADQYASYKVVAGDTLIAIARRQLGNGERWTQIHELNANVLGPDAILKIGMTLKLPGDAKSGAKQSNNTRNASEPASSGKTYTVVSGDTLGQVSMKLLGTSKRVDEFVQLNNLDDANDIRVGMTLKVPAK